MKKNYFLLIMAFCCLFSVTEKSYGQEKSNKEKGGVYGSLEPTDISRNINFDELLHQVNHEDKLKQVLLKNSVYQLLIRSNDKKALDILLKNNKSVCGIPIINNMEVQPENYNQLDLIVSYSAYQVEVVLSEVKGLIVEKKEKYWIKMPNIQLR